MTKPTSRCSRSAAQLAGALLLDELAEPTEREHPEERRSAVELDVQGVAPESDRPAPALCRHGSTFLDDEYVIKGVAGRLLWKVVTEHASTGRTAYTNREAWLDPALQMPSFKDNFESRLVLLKRRLEERDSRIRIARPGRGRFEVDVHASLQLERIDTVDG